MTPTNVVSMNFKSKEAMQEFLDMYERDSPTLYPDAEMLLMIKTTETSCVGVSVLNQSEFFFRCLNAPLNSFILPEE